MKKIGITGSNGFVGTHLQNTLGLIPDDYEFISFERSFFDDENQMQKFVQTCDVIVHLAALNRHNDPDTIYKTNIQITQKLVDALIKTGATPHVLISSSTQEERDNIYGKSKKEAREILVNWAKKSNAVFTGMVIPNVFGPFGDPFYNSVVATFCHQVAHNQTPEIQVDGDLQLIYVGELVNEIIQCIELRRNEPEYNVAPTANAKVSDILKYLLRFKEVYQKKGEIPSIKNTFELNLFNTYRCYMDIKNYFPRKYVLNSDNRGSFAELMRSQIQGQLSFSTTVPGITRGNHFHTRKIERFAVIRGKAIIELRRIGTDEKYTFELSGDEPAYVDMPIWYTHNIKNVGDDILYTNFWINEPYNPEDADTYFEIV